MIRAALVILAVISVFCFPYPATIVLSFVASLFLPATGFVLGALVDVLYFAPGASWLPLATVTGATISVVAFLVRRLVKARIIGG